MLTRAQRIFSLNTAVIFLLITFLHAIRLLRGRQVTIKGAVVPIWISWIALAIAAYLAYEGFRLAKPRRSSSESVQRGIFLQSNEWSAALSQAKNEGDRFAMWDACWERQLGELRGTN
jgi:D-alanyl-lipoteichoic acid acyltransferase DltB (MBOAT superfamily)